jgi:pullulanase
MLPHLVLFASMLTFTSALATTDARALPHSRAHWVAADVIAWPLGEISAESRFQLHSSPEAALQVTEGGVEGGMSVELTVDPAGLPQALIEKFPHLRGATAIRLGPEDAGRAAEILRGQVAVSALAAPRGGGAARLLVATGLQIPGVLDDLFYYPGELGLRWADGRPTLKLWAPTAQSVWLHLFADSTGEASAVLAMERDEQTGVWQVAGEPEWKGRFYLYEVAVYAPTTGRIERNLVADPHSVSLAMNSTRSQIVDLRDPAHKPEGWDELAKPEFGGFADISIYEIHMRDFSMHDPGARPEYRGKYLAFAEKDSHGINHLRALAEAGLTHLHLLPTFDIATIEEHAAKQVNLSAEELGEFPSDSAEQRRRVLRHRDQDGYNWGYDPLHFDVPEGSYATDPDGSARVREYRQMVQAINRLGLRVVKDVVYNHTNSVGQSDKSVFDRIVPGYYYRLDGNGGVYSSTCCPNIATEHAMMEKFLVDSIVHWATQYKIDAFRFDLMGHHMAENILRVRRALDRLTVEEHGMNGAEIYVYGEGWNFGEVADNARGKNAAQFNMAGTGIGTFNDRLRDAVRGSGPFDGPAEIIRNQGFLSGLGYDSNRNNPMNPNPPSEAEARERLLLLGDQIRVGLAGNLRHFSFVDRRGETVTGYDVPYGGGPSGYALTPLDTINYIEKHDNQTLYDLLVMQMPVERSMDDRARSQNLGASIVALAQGIPFFHAGQDMLRSKSLERDSYNSGDWFNRLDFTYRHNNFGVGLPPDVPEAQFRYLRPYLANPALVAGPDHINRAADHFREMLRIRYSSPLFRLGDADKVGERLTFGNTGPKQIPGLIVMMLADSGESALDPQHESLVVLFNARNEEVNWQDEALSDRVFALHPVLAKSTDPVVRRASYRAAEGAFNVPARTTAVFVELRRAKAE